MHPLKQPIALLTVFCYLNTFVVGNVLAVNQIVDTTKTPQTFIDKTANGIDLINISSPNNKGVSVNHYNKFNIDTKGVILNNSTSVGNSAIGGVVYANPNLNNSADIILNEVGSTSRSILDGALEVTGTLNAKQIDVESQGVTKLSGTSNADTLDLTGQSVLLLGTVNINNQLNIDASNGDATIAGITNAKHTQVSSTELSKISSVLTTDSLIVTGKKIEILGKTTSSGDITATAIDGVDISSAISGKIISITSGKKSTVLGSIKADTTTVSGNSILVSGEVIARENIQLNATNEVKVTGITSGKNVTIAGDNLHIIENAIVSATEDVSLRAETLEIANASVESLQILSISGKENNPANTFSLKEAQLVAAQDNLDIKATVISFENSNVLSGKNINIQANNFTNKEGRVWAANDITIDKDGTGARADSISNIAGDIITYNGNLALSATDITNKGYKPTYIQDGFISKWSTNSDASDVADVLKNTYKLFDASVLDVNGNIKSEYQADYLSFLQSVITGKPYTPKALALLKSTVVDAAGRPKAGLVSIWGQISTKLSSDGVTNFDEHLKSLLKQNIEVTKNGVTTIVEVLQADGTIAPDYIDEYLALWEAAVGNTNIPSASLILLKDKAVSGTNIIKSVKTIWDNMLNSTTTSYEILNTLIADVFNNDGTLGRLIAGNNIDIDAKFVKNHYGVVSAGGDITISADSTIDNKAYGAAQSLHQVHKRGCFTCHEGKLGYREVFGGKIEAKGSISLNAAIINSVVEGTTIKNFAHLPRIDEFHDERGNSTPIPENAKVILDINSPEITEQARKEILALGLSKFAQWVKTTPSNSFISDNSWKINQPKVRQINDTTVDSPSNMGLVNQALEGRFKYKDYASFLSSDYMMNRFKYSPEHESRMLADIWRNDNKSKPSYNDWLKNQIAAKVSKFKPYKNPEVKHTQYLSKALQLALAQGGATVDNTTPISSSEEFILSNNGDLIKAKIVNLDATDSITLDGGIIGQESISIIANNNINSNAVIKTQGDTTIASLDGSISQQGGGIQAGSTDISAGQDINLKGTKLKVEQDLSLDAGNNLNITSVTQKDSGMRGDIQWSAERNEATRINAGSDISLISANNTNIHASKVNADGKLTLKAKGDINITAGEDFKEHSYDRSTSKSSWGGLKKKKTRTQHQEQELTHTLSKLSGGKGLEIQADKNLRAQGANLTSKKGDINIAIKGDINFEAVEDKKNIKHQVNNSSSMFGIKYKKSGSKLASTTTKNKGSYAQAMGDMALESGGDSTYVAGKLKAGGNISLKAGGDITMLAVYDKSDYRLETYSSGINGLGSSLVSYEDNEAKITRQKALANTTLIDASQVSFTTTGNLVLQGSQVQAEAVNILAQSLKLISTKNSEQYNLFEDNSGVLVRTIINSGYIKQQAVSAHIDADNIMFNGQVLLKDGLSPKGIIATLSSENPDLSHTQIEQIKAQLANQQWHDETKTLSKMGGVIVQAVVSYLTASAGTALVSGITNSTVQAAMQAVVQSMVSQLSTQILTSAITGNKLKLDLGNLLTNAVKAAALAGITTSIDKQMGFDEASRTNPITNKVTDLSYAQLAQQAVMHSAVQSGIYGTSFEDTLKNSVINIIGKNLAKNIGKSYGIDSFNQGIESMDYWTHKALHAGLGCAISSAKGGDCKSGAAGAAIGEMIAESYTKSQGERLVTDSDNVQTEAKLIGQLGAIFAVQVADLDVNDAYNTSSNAIENNNRVIIGIGKVSAKLGKKLIKNGKLTKKDLKDAGLDEYIDIIDDLNTIATSGNPVATGLAIVDIIVGINFNSKKNKVVRKGSAGIDGNAVKPPKSKNLPLFSNAKKVTRKNGRDRYENKKHIYEWDNKKGAFEKYRKSNGKHLGEFDHITGKQTGKAVKSRRLLK